MFLRNKIEYGSEYIPFTVALSEFLYDGVERSIPFFVGNDLLKKIEDHSGNEYIEFLNTRVVGPIPYVGDDVALFVGLFRVKVADLFKNLFSFLENILSSFDATQLSKYIDIAGICSSGLASLLGIKEMDLRIGNRDVFTSKPNDPKRFKECYLAYINCADGSLGPDKLWIRDDSPCLFTGSDKNTAKPLRDYDYCLVRIDKLEKRNDYTKFSFHNLWNEARELIWAGKLQEAELKMAALGLEMARSPDLITDHRHELIRLYRANFEKDVEAYELSHSSAYGTPAPATRSAWRGEAKMDAKAAIQRMAYLTRRSGYSRDVERSLLGISSNLERIPYIAGRSKEFKLTDAILNEQLSKLSADSRIEKPDPKALADAIALAAMNPS